MEQNNFFKFAIEQTLEMIIVFDESGRILYANPAAENKLKYTGNLPGRKMKDIFPMEEEWQEDFNEEEENVKESNKLFAKAATEPKECMAYRGNRTCFPVRAKIVPYTESEEEKRVAYICIANDISMENFLKKKVEQVEEEAREAAKVKTEFVANVTHELRTPVNGILGNVQELMNRETMPGNLKFLQLIERGCRDMNNLINNILDFSKMEAGKFSLECRKFNFRSMLEYVKGNHNSRMIEKGLEFSIAVSEEIPEYIIGDELRIVQILNNLVSNAYKFTSIGGVYLEIVKTAQTGNRLELFFMVTDSGIGIAKENQDKLFKSFSQVDMSVSRKYGGTGLGLNICKQLVELMDGNIHVESEKGQGTVFSFHIWVELPEEEVSKVKQQKNVVKTINSGVAGKEQELINKLKKVTTTQVNEKIWKYGEPENQEELQKKLSKLMLSMLMENWEKAEMLAEHIKQLVEDAPKEIKNTVFRMKMAIQKEDAPKATECYEKLQDLMEDRNGE